MTYLCPDIYIKNLETPREVENRTGTVAIVWAVFNRMAIALPK